MQPGPVTHFVRQQVLLCWASPGRPARTGGRCAESAGRPSIRQGPFEDVQKVLTNRQWQFILSRAPCISIRVQTVQADDVDDLRLDVQIGWSRARTSAPRLDIDKIVPENQNDVHTVGGDVPLDRTDSPRHASRRRSVPGPRKSLHKCVCELGGSGHITDVTAGQLDQRAAKLLTQFDVYLIAGITTRFPPGHRHDPVGMRFERVKIEVDRRILA